MFYTAAYAAMNVGAFAVVSHFANAGEKYVTLDDYAGLGKRSPVLAATLTTVREYSSSKALSGKPALPAPVAGCSGQSSAVKVSEYAIYSLSIIRRI